MPTKQRAEPDPYMGEASIAADSDHVHCGQSPRIPDEHIVYVHEAKPVSRVGNVVPADAARLGHQRPALLHWRRKEQGPGRRLLTKHRRRSDSDGSGAPCHWKEQHVHDFKLI